MFPVKKSELRETEVKQAGEFLEDTIGSVESTTSVIPPEGLTRFPGYLLCVCVSGSVMSDSLQPHGL